MIRDPANLYSRSRTSTVTVKMTRSLANGERVSLKEVCGNGVARGDGDKCSVADDALSNVRAQRMAMDKTLTLKSVMTVITSMMMAVTAV